MKTNLGKPLSKSEMKAVQGGKIFGCAVDGQTGRIYQQGCCSGYSQCSYEATCQVGNQICDPIS